jgi:hypothetical protein
MKADTGAGRGLEKDQPQDAAWKEPAPRWPKAELFSSIEESQDTGSAQVGD